MRLLIGAAAVGLLGLVGLRSKPAVPAGQNEVDVTVGLKCDSDGMHFSVSPWTATLHQGDTIAWVLDTTADADTLVVNAKPKRGWPFKSNPPYRGSKKEKATGRDMKSGQQGKSYPYSITLSCNNMPGSRTVVIDPDMIIQ